MLEFYVALLLQFFVSASGGTTPANTPVTNGNKPASTESTKIGSGGWDDRNVTRTSTSKTGTTDTSIGSGGWDDRN